MRTINGSGIASRGSAGISWRIEKDIIKESEVLDTASSIIVKLINSIKTIQMHQKRKKLV